MGLRGGRNVKNAGDFTASGGRYGTLVIFATLVRLLRGRGILLRNAAQAYTSGIGTIPDPVRVQPVHDPHREIPGAGRGPLYRCFHRRRHHWGKLRPVGPDSGGPVLLHLLRRGGGRPDGVHGHGVPRAAGGARMGPVSLSAAGCADLHTLRGYAVGDCSRHSFSLSCWPAACPCC